MTIARNDHWLFICSANLVRSPTAEYVARKMGCFASSCGTRGKSTLSDGMVVIPLQWFHYEWADVIVCMEQEHVAVVKDRAAQLAIPVYCWDLPDNSYRAYDEELVKLCEARFLETLQKYENQ